MSTLLDVYLHTHRIGRLWLDQRHRFVFQYNDDWLGRDTAIALSLRLPLRPQPYVDDYARPFFANLLPESDLRRQIARKLGISEQNDFALLEAVGGECAGAVSLLPKHTPLATEGSYRALDDDQLDALVADLPKHPMLAGEQGLRLSLAGAQNKLPVYFDGRHVSLPIGAAPSTHILKPPIAHYPHTVQNEAFCMALARHMGLPVPDLLILPKRMPLYLIGRYDRERGPRGDILRLHQEDFCQALGVAPELKYEKEGGPSLAACFNLVRQHSIQPVRDLHLLLRWVVFNYLIGNADAHAKNISLLLTPRGPTLAPFYDLLSTTVYPDLSGRLAMKVGGEDRPDWVIERRWVQFALDIGIGFKLVRRTLATMSRSLRTEAVEVADGFEQRHGRCETIGRIVTLVDRRCRKVETALRIPTNR